MPLWFSFGSTPLILKWNNKIKQNNKCHLSGLWRHYPMFQLVFFLFLRIFVQKSTSAWSAFPLNPPRYGVISTAEYVWCLFLNNHVNCNDLVYTWSIRDYEAMHQILHAIVVGAWVSFLMAPQLRDAAHAMNMTAAGKVTHSTSHKICTFFEWLSSGFNSIEINGDVQQLLKGEQCCHIHTAIS